MKKHWIWLMALVVLVCTLGWPTSVLAGWTYFSIPSHARGHVQWARACKHYQVGGYGPVWRVTFHAQRKTNTIIGINAKVLRYRNPTSSTIVSNVSNYQWLYGVVSGLDTYASVYFQDRIRLRVLMPNRRHAYVYGGGSFRGAAVSALATC